MRVFFNRNDLVSHGWDLKNNATKGLLSARLNDQSMIVRDLGETLMLDAPGASFVTNLPLQGLLKTWRATQIPHTITGGEHMRIIFTRSNMVETGWTLDDTDLGIMASHDDREGQVTLMLRDLGTHLEFSSPELESFNDGKFMAHLFDVLNENNTAYTIV